MSDLVRDRRRSRRETGRVACAAARVRHPAAGARLGSQMAHMRVRGGNLEVEDELAIAVDAVVDLNGELEVHEIVLSIVEVEGTTRVES